MKDSRVSIQNRIQTKLNTCLPKSNISSLKAIINQGRIPLSQYINHRPQKPVPSHQHLSYFDKLKAMLNRESESAPFQNNCNIMEQPVQGMDIEPLPNKFINYLNNYQENGLHAQTKNTLQVIMKNKSRSKSVNTKIKYGQINNTSFHPPRPSHSKMPTYTEDNFIQSNNMQIQQSNKNHQNVYNLIKSSKSYKKETVNYKKYNVMFQNQEWIGGLVDLQEVLGSGATATVRLGRDKKTSRQFAIKIYEKYKLVQNCKKKRVLQQIELLSKLKHPNIVAMSHCFEDKRQIHLILELVPEAETLHDFIRKNNYDVPSSIKKQIGVKILQAVKYMHNLGIAHRDIKTQNIILGANAVVKLIDFGFATTAAKTETHCGTPNYMAPELFQKKSVYIPLRVDVWALGVLLYYLQQGCYPFRGYNEKDLIRSIFIGNVNFKKCDQKTRRVIQLALKVQQKQRATVHEMLQILKN